MTNSSVRQQLLKEGFTVQDSVLSPAEVEGLIEALDALSDGPATRKRSGIFAVRNLIEECPQVGLVASSATIRNLAEPIMGADFFPVRAILFDKIPDANWKVPWHQDLTIAVEEKRDLPGFGPWSMKAGVCHVQPPHAVLEGMLTVRIHLDDCGADNGPLRVLPGSHLRGRIPENEIEGIRADASEHVCAVRAGGALLMRPLLLHASSPSTVPGHRRVVHLDFASKGLPGDLRWVVR